MSKAPSTPLAELERENTRMIRDLGLKPTRHMIDDSNPIQMPKTLMARPKFNTSGKAAQIQVNSHKILEYPTRTIHQYDVC